MEIVFKSKRLAKTFNSAKELQRNYTSAQAKKIQTRLKALQGADSLGVFWPPYSKPERCHQLEGKLKDVFSIDLVHPFRLLFVPDHSPVPMREDVGVDWYQVTAIKITGVEDTHG